MNKFLLFAMLTVLTLNAAAQQHETKEVVYCGETFHVPENCSANSKSEVNCSDFIIQWRYMNSQMLRSMPDQFVRQLEGKLRKAKKEPVSFTSLGEQLSGYKISYKNKRDINYKLVAHGAVNGQPVMVIVSLQNNPRTNEALPEFVRKILELKTNTPLH